MPALGTFFACTFTKLEMLCQGRQIGTATGFFFKQDGSWYLVTNWHVLSGRDNSTGQPRNNHGAVPDHCRFRVGFLSPAGLVWQEALGSLGDATLGSATWFEHPAYGQQADVAALPLGPLPVGLAKDLLDPEGNSPNMFIDLGAELFLPGYPLGLAANGNMAIWKRASLASSLEFGQGINHSFYVDTATREGMSGAPCFAVSNWRHYEMERSSTKLNVVERPGAWRFLGVYSGRRNKNDGFEAQIGVVWRENLVLETIISRKPATVVLA